MRPPGRGQPFYYTPPLKEGHPGLGLPLVAVPRDVAGILPESCRRCCRRCRESSDERVASGLSGLVVRVLVVPGSCCRTCRTSVSLPECCRNVAGMLPGVWCTAWRTVGVGVRVARYGRDYCRKHCRFFAVLAGISSGCSDRMCRVRNFSGFGGRWGLACMVEIVAG